MTTDRTDGDSRLLALSIWVALAWAAIALAWGVTVRSQMIVFDGLYSFVSVLLSLLSLLALRAIRKGPSDRFPFGREAFEPMTIIVKAFAIAGLCVYAVAGSIMDLATGGREVDADWALVYAAAATVGCGAMALYLRRKERASRSGLVHAETMQWSMDTLLSAGIAVGFVVAVVLQRTGHPQVARYVDPAMVAVVAGAFLVMPLRLLSQGLREALGMAAPSNIHEQVRARVVAIERRHGFADSYVRVAKIGPQLDILVDFIVDEGSSAHDVEAFDAVRQELAEELDEIGFDRWLTVSFTADRRWAV